MDPAPPPANPPTSLDYGPRPRLHQRPLLRRIVIVNILIAASAFSVQQIRSHWPELHLYYLQHECLAHPIPPSVVVYSSAQPSATFKSPEFDAFIRAFTQLRPRALVPFAGAKFGPVYLGTRVANDGTKRFLVIYVKTGVSGPIDPYYESLFIINRPAGIAPLDDGLNDSLAISQPLSNIYIPPDVLVNSAVEDPKDASHLTVTFDANAVHYVYELYVQPGGSILIRRALPR